MKKIVLFVVLLISVGIGFQTGLQYGKKIEREDILSGNKVCIKYLGDIECKSKQELENTLRFLQSIQKAEKR